MSSPITGTQVLPYPQYPQQQPGAAFPGAASQGGFPGAPAGGPQGAAGGVPQDVFENNPALQQALMQAMAQQQPAAPQAGQPTQAQGSITEYPGGGFADKNISLSGGGGGFFSGWKGWGTIAAVATTIAVAFWNKDKIWSLFGKSASAKAAELLKNLHGTEKGLQTELAKAAPEADTVAGFGSGISEFVEKTKKLLGDDSGKHEVLDGLHSNFEKLKDALGKKESITDHHKELSQSFNRVYSEVIKPTDAFKTAVQEHLGDTHKAATEAADSLLEKLAGENPPTGKEAIQELEERLSEHTTAAERMLEDHGLGKEFFNPEELLQKASQGDVADRQQALETLKHKLNLAHSNQFGLSPLQQDFKRASQGKAEIEQAITKAKTALGSEKLSETSIKAAKDKATAAEKAAAGIVKSHVDDDIRFAEELAQKTPEEVANTLPGELTKAAEQHKAAIQAADQKLATQLSEDERTQALAEKQAAEKLLNKVAERQKHVADLNKRPLLGTPPTIGEKAKEIKEKAAEQLKKLEEAEATKQAHSALAQERADTQALHDTKVEELAKAQEELASSKKALEEEAAPPET